MTRKDYELIAHCLRQNKHTTLNSMGFSIYSLTVHCFRARLQAENPNFDAARFLRACGIEEV